MDKFKEKTMKDYTAWDLNCPYVCRRYKEGRKLIKMFKRKARRILKREIDKEQEWKKNG